MINFTVFRKNIRYTSYVKQIEKKLIILEIVKKLSFSLKIECLSKKKEKFAMKKMIMSLAVLISMCLLASCGALPSSPTVAPTNHQALATTPGTSTTQAVAPSEIQPISSAMPPRVHLHVGAGVQLAHFYVTVTRAELHTVQTPPPGMTYLLVTASLRNTTNVDRPLLPANFILHDEYGKAYVAHVYSGAPAPPYGVVKPGATMLGPLVYLIPLSQTDYTFTYQWTGGLAQASLDIVTFTLPPMVHLQVGTGVQLAHFYVTVTRAELHTIQTPPPGMTYLLVTATLRNTTPIGRPLFAANYILHDASGKAYYPHTYSGAPAPPYGVVKPGATILGPLVFLVPVPVVQTHYTFTYQWTGGLAQASWDIVI